MKMKWAILTYEKFGIKCLIQKSKEKKKESGQHSPIYFNFNYSKMYLQFICIYLRIYYIYYSELIFIIDRFL